MYRAGVFSPQQMGFNLLNAFQILTKSYLKPMKKGFSMLIKSHLLGTKYSGSGRGGWGYTVYTFGLGVPNIYNLFSKVTEFSVDT